jgi:uncharacterized membrane protein YdbT with pleckstrin-like domain
MMAPTKRENAMGYVDTVLEPGEKVIFRTSLSWTLYGRAIGLAIVALALPVLAAGAAGWGTLVFGASALIGLAAFLSFLHAWFRRATTEVAVTDRRVILKRGFIRRHTVEMNMQKVESVDVDQSQFGRLFNYGAVTIRGTGTTLERLARIDHPLKLRSAITAG